MNNNNHLISVIIPVLNEEDLVVRQHAEILKASTSGSTLEIIYVDGGSEDQTAIRAKELETEVLISEKGRARQMNLGAKKAKGNILYFLHADTLPPQDFDQIIINALSNGTNAGCFRMKFDSDNWFLSFFAWFTRFNHWLCRGGDQSLFISREQFENLGGFNEDYAVYEDLEFIGRIYQSSKFKVMPQQVITSARKYNQVGQYKLQYHFAVIHLKSYLGASPEALYDYYKRHIQS